MSDDFTRRLTFTASFADCDMGGKSVICRAWKQEGHSIKMGRIQARHLSAK